MSVCIRGATYKNRSCTLYVGNDLDEKGQNVFYLDEARTIKADPEFIGSDNETATFFITGLFIITLTLLVIHFIRSY